MTGRARQALWVVAAFLALKSVLASWSNPASDPLHAFVIYAPTSIVTAWFAWTFYRRMPLAVGVGLVIAILELIDAAFGAFNAFDPALP